MVTMKDIARDADVSVMTVSNALRGKDVVAPGTARRILDIADHMGYQVDAATLSARSLRARAGRSPRGSNGAIGVAIFEFDNLQPSRLAAEISKVAGDRGWQTLVQQTCTEVSGERSILEGISNQFCDGLIFSSQMIGPEEIAAITRRRPTVLIDDDRLQHQLDTVLSPCEEGSAAAIEYLWNRGRRRIGVVGDAMDVIADPTQCHSVGARRIRGCMDAFERLGMAWGGDSFIDTDWRELAARDAIHAHAARLRDFDALYCLTDTIAFGVLRGLHDLGIGVPDDIAVMGFDGVVMGEVSTPSLTTVAVDLTQTARLAVECVLDRMSDNSSGAERRRCVADFHIEQRESA